MASHIVVAAFDNRNQAYDTAYDIDRLDDSLVDFKSGVIVEKDRLGNVTTLDTRNLGGRRCLPAPWALLGILIGALAGPGGAAVGSAAAAAVGSSPTAGGLLGGVDGCNGRRGGMGPEAERHRRHQRQVAAGRMARDHGSLGRLDRADRYGGAAPWRHRLPRSYGMTRSRDLTPAR